MSTVAMVRVTATGEAVAGGARVLGLHYATSTTTGRITLRDGGATGSILIDLDTPPQAEGDHVSIEGNGILFSSSVHVSALTNVVGLSIVYRPGA